MYEKYKGWITRHPNLFAFVLIVAVFIYTTHSFGTVVSRQKKESRNNLKAFCGLIYLFDQSVKIQGHGNVGPLQGAYDQWKKDARASSCPKKPDIVVPSTTTTTTIISTRH